MLEGTLCAFPFKERMQSDEIGIAKSGLTYNHKDLWPKVRPKGCRKSYNYYPRGRVDVTNRGEPIIYMSAYVDISLVKQIRTKFEIDRTPVIKIDGSRHYKCNFDSEWNLRRVFLLEMEGICVYNKGK